MPARRSSSRSALAALLAVALAGCSERTRDEAAPGARAAPSASPEPKGVLLDDPLTELARSSASATLASVRALSASLDGRRDARADYLALRRAVASGAPFWTLRAKMGAEALLGPPRSLDEGGGALLQLDRALSLGELAEAARQAKQIELAALLIDGELARSGVPLDSAARALSSAAYDLGAEALESTATAPGEPDAVLADLRGTLDAIERGAAALGRAPGGAESSSDAVRAVAAPLRARLDAAKTALDLRGRASFVVATGELGARLRLLADEIGAPVDPPYRARTPIRGNGAGEPVSALTLPGPRAGWDASREAAFAALGQELFFERRLSRGGARSCASCHMPERAFADGLARPESLVPGGSPLRHTPTLLYTSLHAAQMWDGRTLTAADQALGVIHSPAEMGLEVGDLLSVLAATPAYARGFAEVSDGGLTAENVARALVAFEVRYLVPDDAPIDRFARGDADALDADESAGLDVFAGRGRCARCHVPPLFGGSRPKDFAVPVFAALGVPTGPKTGVLDPDRGRGAVTGRAADEHAFKTPTVRDIALTAPYFHHGAYARLEDVIDLYDRGGGRGLGLDVPNQDPDVRPLRLTAAERRALLAFLRRGLLDRALPAFRDKR